MKILLYNIHRVLDLQLKFYPIPTYGLRKRNFEFRHSNFKNSFISNRMSELREILNVGPIFDVHYTVKISTNSDVRSDRY
ncbi:hypothetical protein ACS0TY_008904 [Phlomoides rotata]